MSQSRFARLSTPQLENISVDAIVDARIKKALSSLNREVPPRVAVADNRREPKWIRSKTYCLDSFKKCDGQLNNFLAAFLPNATDYAEQISAKLDPPKAHQIKEIFDFLSHNSISGAIFNQQLEKSLKVLRNKSTAKIYRILQKNKGCIFTKFGEIIPCRFHSSAFIPIPRGACRIHRLNGVNWHIPNDVKEHGFIIIAFEAQRRKIIQKIIFDPLTIKPLHHSTMRH